MADKIPNIKFTGTKVVLVNQKNQKHHELTVQNLQDLINSIDEVMLDTSFDFADFLLFYAIPVHEEITEEVTNG